MHAPNLSFQCRQSGRLRVDGKARNHDTASAGRLHANVHHTRRRRRCLSDRNRQMARRRSQTALSQQKLGMREVAIHPSADHSSYYQDCGCAAAAAATGESAVAIAETAETAAAVILIAVG